MKEELLKYMSERTNKLDLNATTGGPIVTISREKGCPANKIAEKLTKALSKIEKDGEWSWVNKDIIEESARELHMNPSKINHVLYSEDKGFFRDLMLSFGEHYYESDVKVKKTLADLISKSASKGKIIVVGLGGVAITKNIEKALHIKLVAPLKFRLNEVMRMDGMNAEKAREYIEETDVNRTMVIDYFNGIKAGKDLFHITFNCSKMNEEEVVQSIIELMRIKKLI